MYPQKLPINPPMHKHIISSVHIFGKVIHQIYVWEYEMTQNKPLNNGAKKQNKSHTHFNTLENMSKNAKKRMFKHYFLSSRINVSVSPAFRGENWILLKQTRVKSFSLIVHFIMLFIFVAISESHRRRVCWRSTWARNILLVVFVDVRLIKTSSWMFC